MAQNNTKLCDFSNTNNNDFISTLIPPITDAESCEINAALLNLVTKGQFSGLPSEDAATHLNNFVDLCDMQKKRDTDNDIVKLKLFPFSLRDRAKTWFLLGNVAWETKIFLPFTKINLVEATTRGECDLRTLVDR